MSESLFSPAWYRVADLRPRLRGHVQVHRHSYRDDVWFVLQDHLSGRFHRFSEAANRIIGLMDGQRTVDEIWQLAAEELGDDSPTQEEMIRLLAQLHAADVLQSEVPPDSAEIFKRYQQQERARVKQRIWSPLALRFRLFDPERFLVRTLPLVRPLYGPFGFLLWLSVVATGAVLAAMHWGELTSDLADRVLAPQNLLLIWLLYPLIKAVHELGHAYATKVWGGEVHEIGIMLLVFMPVPYVDASAASAFRRKRRRVIVGAAGIMVELFLAAVALVVWLNAEHGLVRAIAYNTMLIGGISTLFFNGNPLLRFDGYYVLADAVEIPNLAQRSQKYLTYLLQRYLFGMDRAQSPATGRSERKWFIFYGIASVSYRLFIAVAIILFVSGVFFVVGILLALWASTTLLVLPMVKGLKFLLSDPRLGDERPRALLVSIGLLVLVGGLVFLVPVPYRTLAEGVVWLPERATVRAGADCFVRSLERPADSQVEAGSVLIRCEDPLLRARQEGLEARLRELKALLDSQWRDDRVAARVTREEIRAVEADLLDVRQRMDAMSILSPVRGRLVVPLAQDLPGRFVRQGETLGYVVEPVPMTVRVAVPEDDADLVRSHTDDIQVRLADRVTTSTAAAMVRQIPGGSDRLPSPVLGKSGGGVLDTDPRDPDGVRTFGRIFQYELALPAEVPRSPAGTRVYVRFDHGRIPLGFQWYRRARQVFLGKFGI
ncbi:MAG: PqqD family peptide modification chaperone [Oceanospirillaceae bacterium]|nr:PqqD family peptide modification chaperone [Oceanospirillaceae bacterium]